jgi:hypothetical protein
MRKNIIPNPNAVALGRLAKGYPKTMSAAAIAQRKAASDAAKEARKVKAKEKAKLK